MHLTPLKAKWKFIFYTEHFYISTWSSQIFEVKKFKNENHCKYEI